MATARRAPRSPWFALLAAWLLLGACLGYPLLQYQRRVETLEGDRLRAAAQALGEIVGGRLAAGERALAMLAVDAASAPPGDGYSGALWPARLRALAGNGGMMIVDRAGRVSAASRPEWVGREYGGDLDLATALRSSGAHLLRLEAPVAAAPALLRTIADGGGERPAAAIVVFDRPSLQGALAAVRYAPDVQVALVDGEGVPLATLPATAADDDLISASQDLAVSGIGALRPLRVSVSRPRSAVGADWRPLALRQGGLLLALAGLSAGALLFWQRGRPPRDELTEQLQARLERVQRLEVMSAMARTLTHDFNNLLVGLLGYAELGRTIFAGQDGDARAATYFARIESAGQRLRSLILQWLVLARGDPLPLTRVTLPAALQEAVTVAAASLPTTLGIALRLADDLPALAIDPSHLQSMLVNLCLNAGHAVGDRGSVVLSARRQVFAVAQTCTSCHREFSGEFVCLAVSDDGEGFPEKLQERIFAPFFSMAAVPSEGGKGLAVVHGLTHLYAGHLLIVSRAGQGTEVSILLPRAAWYAEASVDAPAGEA